ncbi:MAG: hypothetical protein AAFV53_24100 [Myxococcota bacterium]
MKHARLALVATMLAVWSTSAAAEQVLRLGQTAGLGSSTSTATLNDFAGDDGWQSEVSFDAGGLPYLANTVDLPNQLAASEDDCNGQDCASMMTILFEVPAEMVGRAFILHIERYGSEWNSVHLDGAQVGGTSGKEGAYLRSRFVLGELDEGEHSVSLWLTGAGNIGDAEQQKNFIDRIILIAE